MKKVIPTLIMAVAITINLNTQAQEKKEKAPKTEKQQQVDKSANESKLSPEQIADRQIKKYTEKLKLSEEQVAKVRQILVERAKSVDADKEKCKGDATCLKSAKRERNRTCETQLKKVLTAEQYQKLQEIRKKAREKAKEKGKGANPDAEPTDDIIESPEQ
jgi:hypothetical protein